MPSSLNNLCLLRASEKCGRWGGGGGGGAPIHLHMTSDDHIHLKIALNGVLSLSSCRQTDIDTDSSDTTSRAIVRFEKNYFRF